jgi:hypothetical protein
VMFALAVCSASVLVGCLLGAFFRAGTFATDPAVGMVGSIGVAAVRSCATGCITIGVSGIFFAMADNASGENSFDVSSSRLIPHRRGHRRQKTPPGGLTGSVVRLSNTWLLMRNKLFLSAATLLPHVCSI